MNTPENPGLPPQMDAFVKRQARQQAINAEVSRISTAGSEAIENEVLVDLWAWLGDRTVTYWSAFTAAKAFVAIDDFVNETLADMPNDVRCHLLEAYAAIMIRKAGVMRQIAARREELERENPIPGDPA